MDTLSYGCPILMRSCIDKSIKRPEIVSSFNFQKILEDFKMKIMTNLLICVSYVVVIIAPLFLKYLLEQ